MKGLERYETLKAAVNIIAAAEKKCLTVGDRMAWAKLYRVEKYLLGQAGHVVDEPGAGIGKLIGVGLIDSGARR